MINTPFWIQFQFIGAQESRIRGQDTLELFLDSLQDLRKHAIIISFGYNIKDAQILPINDVLMPSDEDIELYLLIKGGDAQVLRPET
jgi:hypothetical protein